MASSSSLLLLYLCCLTVATLWVSTAASSATDCSSAAATTDSLVIGGKTISQPLVSIYVEQFKACKLVATGSTSNMFRTARLESPSCTTCFFGDCLLAERLPADVGGCRHYQGPDCHVYKGGIANMADPCV